MAGSGVAKGMRRPTTTTRDRGVRAAWKAAPLSDHGGRLPLLAADGLEPEQQELYDEIARGPRAAGPFSVVDGDGHLLGPFNALLHTPGVGAPVDHHGATGVVELCALVGYYQLLGGVLAAADIPAPVSDDDAEGVQ